MLTWEESDLVYQRSLLPLAHGFPCARFPPGYYHFPKFHGKGFVIGDLVMVERKYPGATSKLFNIFKTQDQNLDHSAQRSIARLKDNSNVTISAFELEQLELPEIREQKGFFPPKSWITSDDIKQTEPSSPKVYVLHYPPSVPLLSSKMPKRKHEFLCAPEKDGTVIGFPLGGDRQDIIDTKFLLPYIRRNAKKWYELVLQRDDSPETLNGSLFLITGLDTTNRFYGVPVGQKKEETRIRFIPRPINSSGGEASEEEYYDVQGYDCYIIDTLPIHSWNMVVFVRGFLLLLAPTILSTFVNKQSS